jgi:hypothetical protein
MSTESNATQVPQKPARPLTPLADVAASLGKTTSTLWRWRKNGWLRTVNICGKIYISDAALAEFTRRAEAGEFSKKPVVPLREKQEASA